ncbi:hypothetical protein J4573_31485 [Actinomadura barringtoniae]|uniref:Uncharacterized protein n=1 Tax=Actinomadura barringtoniae TaxID=1427535 RepID=A0A939PFD1_9ACTN|nr:hypothetical protein [Actinomadura barringtoniae]MBO2451650.1 hypothetical protein [Actinomadura barringtoniae]
MRFDRSRKSEKVPHVSHTDPLPAGTVDPSPWYENYQDEHDLWHCRRRQTITKRQERFGVKPWISAASKEELEELKAEQDRLWEGYQL